MTHPATFIVNSDFFNFFTLQSPLDSLVQGIGIGQARRGGCPCVVRLSPSVSSSSQSPRLVVVRSALRCHQGTPLVAGPSHRPTLGAGIAATVLNAGTECQCFK